MSFRKLDAEEVDGMSRLGDKESSVEIKGVQDLKVSRNVDLQAEILIDLSSIAVHRNVIEIGDSTIMKTKVTVMEFLMIGVVKDNALVLLMDKNSIWFNGMYVFKLGNTWSLDGNIVHYDFSIDNQGILSAL